jgi:D-alanyl-D-alanine carboxypeptidase/D-alanyl-D-alanine-endopeptidase (penicillin-binding protein 4)
VAWPWALAAALVVVALVAATALTWTTGRLNPLVCGGPCGPEAVAAPEALALDARVRPAAPDPTVTARLDPDAVRAAVEPELDDDRLGDRVGVLVAALDGTALFAREADGAFVPASTTKLLTAFAVLARLDPGARFSTSTVLDGDRVVLVGGGDPYLASTRPERPTRVDRADLRTLARRTAAALADRGVRSVAVGYDATRFSGPSASPAWEDDYVSGQVVTPVSALWADRGITDGIRSADPARAAADRFAGYLEDAGVEVDGDPDPAEAPATGTGSAAARPLASVSSATVAQVVDAMLVRSDNEAAEVLLRQVGIAAGGPGSFAGGTKAVVAALAEAGVPVEGLRLTDGSGLSRANRVSPRTLAGVLQRGASRASTSELLADLPVGGLTGTLEQRFRADAAGRGLVRAKTGTLTGVHSLAGYTTDARGVPVLFAVMTDDTEGIGPFATQEAIDDVADALAACSCGP